MAPIFYLGCVEGEEDAPALAVRLGLDDVALLLGLAPLDLLPELGELAGQQPGPGEEVVLVGVLLGHLVEVEAEQVLAGQHVDAGEVADFLVEVHLHEGVGLDHGVDPEHVPVAPLAAGLHPPLQVLGDVGDHVVVGHCISEICTAEVDDDLPGLGGDFDRGLGHGGRLAGAVGLRAPGVVRLL